MRSTLPVFLFLWISFSSCHFSRESKAEAWRNDSLGTYGYRDLERLNEIMKEWKLEHASTTEMLKILGPSCAYYTLHSPIDTTENQLSYFCCGNYFDENGDGRVDSTKEFLRGSIDLEKIHGKWVAKEGRPVE